MEWKRDTRHCRSVMNSVMDIRAAIEASIYIKITQLYVCLYLDVAQMKRFSQQMLMHPKTYLNISRNKSHFKGSVVFNSIYQKVNPTKGSEVSQKPSSARDQPPSLLSTLLDPGHRLRTVTVKYQKTQSPGVTSGFPLSSALYPREGQA